LAIIDSWDGDGEWGPDFFNVQVDGVSVFSQIFESYSASPGVLLFSGEDLGFSSSWNDSAYNMYLEPTFQNIPHTGSTLTISWFASGPNWQGGDDESWAIENVQVVLNKAFLGFPLPGYTPYTAPVSTVMDNSVLERTPIEFYVPGDVIKAFNGEIGEKQYGVTYLDPYGLYWPAYKNSTGTDFFPPSSTGVRPLNYLNGPYLSYAGNPGYNYQVPEGTPVLATADGKLYQAVTDPVNGAGYGYYNNSYIDHQNGYFSWYLYAPLNSDILAQISLNGYAQVTKGQVIGKTIGDRLHFEVRYNGSDHQNVVDPYKLGLWLPKTGHLEGLLPLLLEDAPPVEY
ncbi:MAG: M23 family metallopeptidase, partial [Deltaproteobacteria bacterium]|nr:M23 family metallopeptidase [Deltaproteobacteria bacterium]